MSLTQLNHAESKYVPNIPPEIRTLGMQNTGYSVKWR